MRWEEIIGKTVQLFLKSPSGFRFSGLVTEVSEGFLTIQDVKGEQIISLDNIDRCSVLNGGGR